MICYYLLIPFQLSHNKLKKLTKNTYIDDWYIFQNILPKTSNMFNFLCIFFPHKFDIFNMYFAI